MEHTRTTQIRSSQVDTRCCTICGDVGFWELTARCCNCETACQHLYCMATSNGEVLEVIPEDWICEDCLRIPGKGNFQKSYGAVHRAVRQGRGPFRRSGYPTQRTHSLKPGKVKFLSTEEVIKLSSGVANAGSPSKNNWENRHGYSFAARKFFPPMVKKNANYISSSPKKLPELGRTPSSSLTSQLPQRPLKELKATINLPKELSCKDTGSLVRERVCKDAINPAKESFFNGQRTTSPKPAKEVRSCNFDGLAKNEKDCSASVIAKEVKNCNKNADEAVNKPSTSALHQPPTIKSESYSAVESKKPDLQGREPLTNLSNLHLYHPHFPAMHVIWKGGFKFFDITTPGKFYGGFLAQPSSRVNRKAYELAQKMPLILQTELLPRKRVRVDLFQNDQPDFRDIALYFLPYEKIERSKENHANLFELIEIQNSVLRSYIDDVELLVFTSKQLDGDSQDVIKRSDVEQFLWGVFRRAKRERFSSKSDFASLRMECDEGIDMVGGQQVGRVDMIVTRESSKTACGESDKETMDENTMTKSSAKIFSLKYADSTIEKLQLDPEKARRNMSPLLSEFSVKSNSDLAFSQHSQGSEEKLPVGSNEVNTLPAFEELSGQNFRSMSCRAKFKEVPDLNDGRAKEAVFLQREEDHPSFRHSPSTKSPSETCNVACWSPPQTDWVKLNVVGISKGNPGVAGSGGILRDESGKYLLGYTINLGTQTSLGAELWALFEGLMLAWNKGYSKVQAECESLIAVKFVKQPPTAMDPNRLLLEGCINLFKRSWVCQVGHVDRDANLSANWLATHFEDHPLGLTIFNKPPDGLVPALQNDCSRIPCHSSRQI